MVDLDRPPDRILAAFGADPAGPVEPLPAGSLNRSWRVATAGGYRVVRRTQDIEVAQILTRQRATSALTAAGLPVPATIPSVHGATVLDDPAGLFEAAAWIDGEHRCGDTLSEAECGDLGALVARLHVALAQALPPDGAGTETDARTDVARRVGQEIERLASLPSRGASEPALAVARRLWRWHGRLSELAPPRADSVSRWPAGWTHGDLQPLNLLWSADTGVVGILDFDHLGRRRYADELVRSALVLFGPDPNRVASFTAGYRRCVRLDHDDIVDAVHLTWWRRLDDLCACAGGLVRGEPAGDQLRRTAGQLEATLAWWSDQHGVLLDALI